MSISWASFDESEGGRKLSTLNQDDHLWRLFQPEATCDRVVFSSCMYVPHIFWIRRAVCFEADSRKIYKLKLLKDFRVIYFRNIQAETSESFQDIQNPNWLPIGEVLCRLSFRNREFLSIAWPSLIDTSKSSHLVYHNRSSVFLNSIRSEDVCWAQSHKIKSCWGPTSSQSHRSPEEWVGEGKKLASRLIRNLLRFSCGKTQQTEKVSPEAMNHNNHQNLIGNHHQVNGMRTTTSIPDDITQSDAISPRFRSDINGQEVLNFCFSCKSEFTTKSIHDLMEHYSQAHERFSSYCLYCKTGKVHQYKSDTRGLQFYHDCYRSKMNYDKWVRWSLISPLNGQSIDWNTRNISNIINSSTWNAACTRSRQRAFLEFSSSVRI